MSEQLEQFEKPKTDLEKLRDDIAEMGRLLELAGKDKKRKDEIQATIDEFNRIQAEVEASESARIDKETIERLERELGEMEPVVQKILEEGSGKEEAA